jgi:hypothetical protein
MEKEIYKAQLGSVCIMQYYSPQLMIECALYIKRWKDYLIIWYIRKSYHPVTRYHTETLISVQLPEKVHSQVQHKTARGT